jgi:3-dehydroquinate synthetase
MITNITTTGPIISVYKYQEPHGENVSIGINAGAESAINWAMMKINEEARIKELAKQNPTVANAAEALKNAEEQLRVVMALVK